MGLTTFGTAKRGAVLSAPGEEEEMEKITLRAARINAGLTQKQAAAIGGVNPSTICRWEAGKALPDTFQLYGMAAVYGINIDDIIMPKPLALSEEKA